MDVGWETQPRHCIILYRVALYHNVCMLQSCLVVVGRSFESLLATVCKTVRPMLSDRCLSCPVCDVGVLWPNGWMDQDATWNGGRTRPRPHCVRWAPSSPVPRKDTHPICGQRLLCTNGWMDQGATWYGGWPRPRPHRVRWEPSSPAPKWAKQPPLFGP